MKILGVIRVLSVKLSGWDHGAVYITNILIKDEACSIPYTCYKLLGHE
jgi:hypothetical protein